MQEQIKAYFTEHRDEMVNDIKTLVCIPSVNAPAEEDYPFGANVYTALEKAQEIANSYGFQKVENVDNYALKIEYGPNEPALGILAHLDVVPAGGGWTVCEPFSCIEKDGMLYGRGVSDDKGPAIAALFALRCVKDLNIPLQKSVQLILGCGEETGSNDIAYYLTKYQMPPAVFSPDGEYPLTNTEKGRVRVDWSATCLQDGGNAVIHSFQGGIAVNAVPAEAKAMVSGITIQDAEQLAQQITLRTKATFAFRKIDEQIEVTAYGINAHAFTPCSGVDA